MAAIVRRLREYRARYALPKQGESVLVACSGGADSLALLFALHELRDEFGIRVSCAHYEHGFRGEESLEDMRFAEGCAKGLGLPFYCAHGNLGGAPCAHGANAQEMAREGRYDFLERARSLGGCDRIALAHTADDQAETVLYKFLRGSSISALAGMPASRERYIRPLIFARRSEIEEYLRARGQDWREDSSNKNTHYLRNLLRRQMLPELEKHFPALTRHLAELSSEAAGLVRDMDCLARGMGLLEREEAGGVSWPLDALRQAPPSLARHVLAQALARQAKRASDLPRRDWYLAFDRRLARHEKSGGLLYHGAAGTVYIHRGRVCCLRPRDPSLCQVFSGEYLLREGEFSFPWGLLRASLSEPPADAGKKFFQEQVLQGIFWLDAVALTKRFILRSARPGERFQLGRGASKKIADVLAESGVPLPFRRAALVLAPGDGPALALFVPAMPAHGRVGGVLLTEGGRHALRLEFCCTGGALVNGVYIL